MQQGERKRFVVCLTACAEVYGKPCSDAVIGVWWDALRQFDIGAVEGAFGRHLQSQDVGQFMPKPADIIRMLQGTSVDAAMVAWSRVDRAIREVGTYVSVTFDDPIAMRVLQDMGGWILLGTKDNDEWPFIGNEFRNRYHGYRSRGEIPECPPVLPGICQAENTSKGYSDWPHVMIGDPQKAGRISQLPERQALTVTPSAAVKRLELTT